MRLLIPLLSASLLACHPEQAQTAATKQITAQPKIEQEAPDGELTWRKIATLPKKHRQACDLESVDGALFIAASTDALGSNGAGLYELSQNNTLSERFDWSGQGFLRVHEANHKLLVPDADAPFGVSFFFRLDVDGFVFAFDPSDTKQYTKEVIPAVYHVFDTATLDGKVYASSGAYAVGETPYRNDRNPAALFLQEDGKPWRRVVEFPKVPKGTTTGVVRFTYLQAIGDGALLAGFTDWSGVEGGDGAMLIEGLPDAPRVTRVKGIAGNTLRWEKFGDKLYHIGEMGGATQLSVSRDGGRSFEAMANSPTGPQALVSTSDTLFLLADGVIYRSTDGEGFTAATKQNEGLRYQWAPLLSAPLELHNGALWAASPITGEIWSAAPQ